jgi:hypothetical protein
MMQMGEVAGQIQQRLRQVQRAEGFTAVRSGAHVHVEKDGRVIAVVSTSPGDGNALKQIDRDLSKAGFLFREPKRQTPVSGEEGRLLYALSNAPRDLSSYSLSQLTGIPIGRVSSVLKGLKHPRLSFENDLWHWDPTDPAAITVDVEGDIPMRDFNIPLRPDVVVKLTLPQDVTKAELAEIAAFLKWIKVQ